MTEPRRARTSSGTTSEVAARRALGATGRARRDGVVHRPVGLGQVDGRGRGRARCSSTRGVLDLHCSTATTCATGSTATSGSPPTTATENVRRVGEVARLFADAGVVALVPLISPYRGRARPRPARCTRPPACRSSRCSSTRRSRCASSATRRASTPRPAAGELTGLHRHRRPLRAAARRPSSSSVAKREAPADDAAAAIVALLASAGVRLPPTA